MTEQSFDRLDRAILRELLNNARISLQDLGMKVGLAASSCWNRVRKMESCGLITGYTVNVDPTKLGYRELVIAQVSLESHRSQVVGDFVELLETIPEVVSAYLVAGECDCYVLMAVEDTRDYERLLREKLYNIPGIRQSKSSFVLRTIKHKSTPLV